MSRRRRIDPRVEVGPLHLRVADLARALAFYEGVLGFEVTQRIGQSAALLSADGHHTQIALDASGRRGGARPPPGTTGLCRFALRYPDREALSDALGRLSAAGVPLESASDRGTSEALCLRDPDGFEVELYYDRPRDQWARSADGSPRTTPEPLDLDSLRRAGEPPVIEGIGAGARLEETPRVSDLTLARLRDMRVHLLNLHKVLLDDAKAAYEMDRGVVGSTTNLLQLVIHDPWFAWLHPLSELVVRLDETLRPDAPATEADGLVLLEEVERLLLSPAAGGERFAQRYYEALQRQPAVIVAHAEVRRILKQAK